MSEVRSLVSEVLEANGWHVVERQVIETLWIAEIWKVCSMWSPVDKSFYLIFEVDGEDGPREFENVKWMKAFRYAPQDWAVDESDILSTFEQDHVLSTCPVGRHQEKYLPAFLNDLQNYRNEE